MINKLLKLKPIDILVALFSLAVFVHIGISLYKIVTTSAPDFSVFYQSTYDLNRGINPYLESNLFTGLGYPIVTTLFFTPFILLPYKIAQGMFVILSAFSVLAIVYLSLLLINRKVDWRQFLFFSALAYLSFPTKFTLGMGQSSLLAYLLLLISYYFYRRKVKITSGIFLGITVLVKPILGFIFLFFILRKEWKIITTALFLIFSLTLLSIILYGFDKYYIYLTYVLPPLLRPVGREIYYNQGLMGFISRLTSNLLARSVITLTGSLFLITVTVKNNKSENTCFALFLTTLALVDTLSWQHHFVFLIFPFIVASNFKKLFFLLLAYFLVSGNIKDPQIFSAFPINLILSHTFFGAVILFICLHVIFDEFPKVNRFR